MTDVCRQVRFSLFRKSITAPPLTNATITLWIVFAGKLLLLIDAIDSGVSPVESSTKLGSHDTSILINLVTFPVFMHSINRVRFFFFRALDEVGNVDDEPIDALFEPLTSDEDKRAEAIVLE